MDANISHSLENFYYSGSTWIKSSFISATFARWCNALIILYLDYKIIFFTCLELVCKIST